VVRAKKAGRYAVAAVATLLAVVGVFFARAAAWRPLALVGEAPAGDPRLRVEGVVHVHTTLSDGGGSPEEVVAAARTAGLSFVAITDHNNLDAKPLEGYRDGVLVLVGSELSTPKGHVLGLGLDRDPPFRFNGDARDAVGDVLRLGGVPFAAHPFSARADLRFTAWDTPGPWGLELLNGDSEWRRAGPRVLWSALLYRANPVFALLRGTSEPTEALARWDTMLRERDVVGLAGADAHSRLPVTRRVAIRFPSYEAIFALARVHLQVQRPLSGDAAKDRIAVTDALRQGRFHIGLDGLASAAGFSFRVEAGGRQVAMGETVGPLAGARARADGRMPAGTRLVLKRDGVAIAESRESLDAALPGAGVYRVEGRVPGWPVPWVITNPVYVFDEATAAARRRASEWPAPAPAAETRPLVSLPGTSEFSPEFDPTSTVAPAPAEAGQAPLSATALGFTFRLGVPGPQQPFTWCALVNRQARDLSGWTGLRFRIKADGEYGLWVQVRDENPASADEGQEWWLAAARTSPEWAEVVLPFERFRTINPRTDGRLDVAKTRAIVFVLDFAAVKPGTRGAIWIDGLSVYR
jgi:hypothetical protein